MEITLQNSFTLCDVENPNKALCNKYNIILTK